MFYDQYALLCEQANKKPYEVARELGCSNSNVAQWKKGSVPRRSMLEKIAEYFGVTVGYLLAIEQKESPATQIDSEDETTKALYALIQGSTPEERKELIDIANYIRSRRGN